MDITIKIDKSIKKSYKYLYKYTQKKKFNSKKNDNLIYLFLLYIQNKYELNFDLNGYTEEISYFKSLKSIYKNHEIIKELFVEDNTIIYDIYSKGENINTKSYLKKIVDNIYKNEYVFLGVKILDSMGNSTNEVNILSNLMGLIWLKEINEDLKVSRKFLRKVKHNLNEIIFTNLGKLRYTNTQGFLYLMVLFNISNCKKYDEFIESLLDQQLPDGRWTNGFNSFFIEDKDTFDTFHTTIALLALLEYRLIIEYNSLKKKNKNLKKLENIEKLNSLEKKITKNNILEEFSNINSKPVKDININNKKNTKRNNSLINFFNNKETKILNISHDYEITYNIYNVIFLILLIFLFYYANFYSKKINLNYQSNNLLL